MREITITTKCDKCHSGITIDDPVDHPHAIIHIPNRIPVKVDLCDNCLNDFNWLPGGPEETLPYCVDCERTFANKAGLRTHRTRYHGEKPVRPDRKKKRTAKQRTAQDKNGKYPCDVCGRTFSTPQGRAGHKWNAHTRLEAKK